MESFHTGTPESQGQKVLTAESELPLCRKNPFFKKILTFKINHYFVQLDEKTPLYVLKAYVDLFVKLRKINKGWVPNC